MLGSWDGFDPWEAQGLFGVVARNLCFESLCRREEGGELRHDERFLAHSIRLETIGLNGKPRSSTRLTEDIRFCDGGKVEPADVASSLERAAPLRGVTGIKAAGARRIQFSTLAGDVDVELQLGQIGSVIGKRGPKFWLGTGPYMIEGAVRGVIRGLLAPALAPTEGSLPSYGVEVEVAAAALAELGERPPTSSSPGPWGSGGPSIRRRARRLILSGQIAESPDPAGFLAAGSRPSGPPRATRRWRARRRSGAFRSVRWTRGRSRPARTQRAFPSRNSGDRGATHLGLLVPRRPRAHFVFW